MPVIIFVVLTLCGGASFFSAFGPLGMPAPDMHAPSIWSFATEQSFTHVQHAEYKGNIHRVQMLNLPGFLLDRDLMDNEKVSDFPFNGLESARPDQKATQVEAVRTHAAIGTS